MKTKKRRVMDTSGIYVRGEENLGDWRPRGTSLIEEHQAQLDKLDRVQEVSVTPLVNVTNFPFKTALFLL